MFEPTHYPASDFPPELACQVMCFMRLVWFGGQQGEDRFRNSFTFTEPADHFVIVERGILVSHALVRQRAITHRGERYRLGGVGAVMTYPAFRREGHGARVVAAATDFIRASGLDIGMLFTMPSLESFYGQNGWVSLNNPGITHGDPTKLDDPFAMLLAVSDHAQAHRTDFEHGPIFVGSSMW